MIVDLVLGVIFITTIICFTIYKINKNSAGKNSSYFSDYKDDINDLYIKKDDMKYNEPSIGFHFKKEKKTLRKGDKKNDED